MQAYRESRLLLFCFLYISYTHLQLLARPVQAMAVFFTRDLQSRQVVLNVQRKGGMCHTQYKSNVQMMLAGRSYSQYSSLSFKSLSMHCSC